MNKMNKSLTMETLELLKSKNYSFSKASYIFIIEISVFKVVRKKLSNLETKETIMKSDAFLKTGQTNSP